MKVLIIDDEPPVRESIKLLIPWDKYGVLQVREACNGEEALEMIERDKPQIVFTDIRMPVMDGIEVLKRLRERGERMKVIIISGYNDFEYVRSALKYGSFDYILKPIDEEELLSVFEKALESWHSEEQTRAASQQISMRANEYKPVLADNMFSRLLQDPDQYRAVARTLQDEYNIGQQSGNCRVAVISLAVLDGGIRRKFESALDLLVFSITNICNELLQPHHAGIAFHHVNERQEIVVLLFQRAGDLQEAVQRIQRALQSVFRSRFYIGVGRSFPFPQGLPKSYGEARTLLKQRNLLEPHVWEHYYEDRKPGGLCCPLTAYEDRLFLAMKRNDRDAIHGLLSEWGCEVSELSCIRISDLELWWQEFVLLVSRWNADASALPAGDASAAVSSETGLTFELPLNESGELSIELLVRRMSGLLSDFASAADLPSTGRTIHEIEQYLRAFYYEDINLQMLSERFYLSPSHISRTFKQQFGANLSDYVSRLRIEKAKMLLADPDIKISSIASSIGYQDEKYFSKAFKRFVGMSPKQFRNMHTAD
mgnify:CR=1 FL=1|jgi:Response regulator containing CheY-like receiver domain and AraC-type DNA-binding domain